MTRLGNLEAEAGNEDAIRAKTDRHTGVNGETIRENQKKHLISEQQSDSKMLTQPSKLAEHSLRYLLFLELKVGEVVNPKLSKQSKSRNEEKRWLGQEKGRNSSRLDEQRNP